MFKGDGSFLAILFYGVPAALTFLMEAVERLPHCSYMNNCFVSLASGGWDAVTWPIYWAIVLHTRGIL